MAEAVILKTLVAMIEGQSKIKVLKNIKVKMPKIDTIKYNRENTDGEPNVMTNTQRLFAICLRSCLTHFPHLMQQVEAQAPTVQAWPLLPVNHKWQCSGSGKATTASTITCISNSASAIQSSALAVLAVRQQKIYRSPAPSTSHSERESGHMTLP